MEIYGKKISKDSPTYFIAEIGSNFDGDIKRAISLIKIAAQSDADAVKFQHYTANSLVSDRGFNALRNDNKTHQSNWKKSVSETYDDASLNAEWTGKLSEAAHNEGLAFITSPYSHELVEYTEPYVDAYKIGSGDITFHSIIKKILEKKKPILIATGASTAEEVSEAMTLLKDQHENVCLMQCNTNYDGKVTHAKYQNLNVLKSFHESFSNCVLGLSCHMPGPISVIGSVALGARVIEKHFTDDRTRPGPDHGFAIEPAEWKKMVEETRLLEAMLGDGNKKIEENEQDTVIVQQRALWITNDMEAGDIMKDSYFEVLRPCPKDAIKPSKIKDIIGKPIRSQIKIGDYLRMDHFE